MQISSMSNVIVANDALLRHVGDQERNRRRRVVVRYRQSRKGRLQPRSFFLYAVIVVLFIGSYAAAAAVANDDTVSSGGTTSSFSSPSRFHYSETDLEACAKEVVAAAAASSSLANSSADEIDINDRISSSSNHWQYDNHRHDNDDGSSCYCSKLYDEFRLHYDHHRDNRALPSLSTSSSSSSSLIVSRFAHFQNTVQFVHEHNSNLESNNHGHKLRLNQFADTSSQSYHHHLVVGQQPQEQEDKDEDEEERPQQDQSSSSNSNNNNNDWQIELERVWNERMSINEDDDDDDEDDDNNQRRGRRSRRVLLRGTDVRLLDTTSSIDDIKEEQEQEKEPRHHRRRSLIWNWNKETRDEIGGEPATLSSILRTITTSDGRTMVMMPGDGRNVPSPFSSPQVPTYIHGMAVELHAGSSQDTEHDHDDPFNEHTEDTAHQAGGRQNRKFSTRLNWSTTYNPDGVSLVHEVFDQGSCGSCWAVSATGSVEASAARNAGRNHFVTGLQHISDLVKQRKQQQYEDEDEEDDDDDDGYTNDENQYYGYETLIEELTKEARAVESKTFQELRLSIQELLDCDTDTNEGCIGGNPLLAFDFIYKNGLVPWKEYPYVGAADADTNTGNNSNNDNDNISTIQYRDDTFLTLTTNTDTIDNKNAIISEGTTKGEAQQQEQRLHDAPKCQTALLTNPIATVESWGLLHKDHEQLIEYALLYVGPVAVGFNGADPKFINYGGGIYDSNDCDQTANHALLIVGYDHDDVIVKNDDGTTATKTIRYWIARNSWGKSWGENGFVKIKRGSGDKGVPGICGIARSPSVALGGVYRGPDHTAPLILHPTDGAAAGQRAYRKHGQYVDTFNSSESWRVETNNHLICNSLISKRRLHSGCMKFMSIYDSNQSIFLALIGLVLASIAMIPLAVSLWKEHHLTIGSMLLDHPPNDEDKIFMLRRLDQRNSSLRSNSSSLTSGSDLSSLCVGDDKLEEQNDDTAPPAPSERTHLLTLKDMYASQRKKDGEQDDEPRYHNPRGRNIIMKKPKQDPFHLVPSSTLLYKGLT